MKRLYLIMNPNSGTRFARRVLPEMISVLTGGGYLCSVYITEKRGDAEAFASEHGAEAVLVIACGGDGTLNEVVSGLLSGAAETPLGYIPAGTTNDFASSLGIPGDPLKACETILSGQLRSIDVGVFGSERYFSYTASFGAFTSVSYSTPQSTKNILGHAAYILQGIRSLADIRPIHLKITSGGALFENDYIFGGVCNSTSLGGILKMENAGVHMNDGLFEALLIPFPQDLMVLNRILTALSTGRYEDPSLMFLRSPAFRVESETPINWSLDGEAAEGITDVEIRNRHNALTLICPDQAVKLLPEKNGSAPPEA